MYMILKQLEKGHNIYKGKELVRSCSNQRSSNVDVSISKPKLNGLVPYNF